MGPRASAPVVNITSTMHKLVVRWGESLRCSDWRLAAGQDR